MRHLFLVNLVACAVFQTCSAAWGLGPDNSDELVQLVRDALATNSALYPQGKLTASVVIDRTPQPKGIYKPVTYRDTADVELRWKNGCHHYRIAAEAATEDGPPTRRAGEFISCPDDRYALSGTLDNGRKLYYLALTRQGGTFKATQIAPDEFWYRSLFMASSFAELLGDDPQRQVEIVGMRVSDELVRIERRYDKGALVSFVVNLYQGGNIIEHSVASPDSGKRTARYEWTEFSPGKWRLKSYNSKVITPMHSLPSERVSVTIHTFDANVEIPRGQFSVASLVKRGVTETIDLTGPVPKLRRVGDEELTEDQLKRLGIDARRRGFAAPKEK